MFKKTLLAGILSFTLGMVFAQTTFSEADFLKVDGKLIRNKSGKGDTITLQGTNLGSWLSMEAWIAPLGSARITNTGWIATASSSKANNPASFAVDKVRSSYWAPDHVADSTWLILDFTQPIILDSIKVNGSFDGKYGISLSEDKMKWNKVEKLSIKPMELSANFTAQKARYLLLYTKDLPSAQALKVNHVETYIGDDFHVRNKLIARFGEKGADKLWDYYQKYWITTADLDSVKSMGMNVVRVPIYWMELMNNSGEIKRNAFKEIDWVLKECGKRRLYVILDLHGAPGGLDSYITSGQAVTNDLWVSQKWQDWTVKIWQALATRYKGNPTVAAYDLLNEPVSSAKETMPYKKFYDVLYKTVRAIDPDHIISMQGFYNLDFLDGPSKSGWTNVLYQAHFYNTNTADKASQNGFLEYALSHLANHQKDWNAPMYAGEYSFWSHTDLWEKWMQSLNSLNISWTNWTYKLRLPSNNYGWGLTPDSSIATNWGFYDTNTSPIPDINDGSKKEIKRRWKKFVTSNFRYNKVLMETVRKHSGQSSK